MDLFLEGLGFSLGAEVDKHLEGLILRGGLFFDEFDCLVAEDLVDTPAFSLAAEAHFEVTDFVVMGV